jgi:hypothetical protein
MLQELPDSQGRQRVESLQCCRLHCGITQAVRPPQVEQPVSGHKFATSAQTPPKRPAFRRNGKRSTKLQENPQSRMASRETEAGSLLASPLHTREVDGSIPSAPIHRRTVERNPHGCWYQTRAYRRVGLEPPAAGAPMTPRSATASKLERDGRSDEAHAPPADIPGVLSGWCALRRWRSVLRVYYVSDDADSSGMRSCTVTSNVLRTTG